MHIAKAPIKETIEKRFGPVTEAELSFAIEQFEKNCTQSPGRKLYDDTAYDIIVTNIDFYRRHSLAKA